MNDLEVVEAARSRLAELREERGGSQQVSFTLPKKMYDFLKKRADKIGIAPGAFVRAVMIVSVEM